MEQSSSRIIRNKLGLLNLAEELHNVSKACRVMGVSRDTFYRYQRARDTGGVEALLDKTSITHARRRTAHGRMGSVSALIEP